MLSCLQTVNYEFPFRYVSIIFLSLFPFLFFSFLFFSSLVPCQVCIYCKQLRKQLPWSALACHVINCRFKKKIVNFSIVSRVVSQTLCLVVVFFNFLLPLGLELYLSQLVSLVSRLELLNSCFLEKNESIFFNIFTALNSFSFLILLTIYFAEYSLLLLKYLAFKQIKLPSSTSLLICSFNSMILTDKWILTSC